MSSCSFVILRLHLLKTNPGVCCAWNCLLSPKPGAPCSARQQILIKTPFRDRFIHRVWGFAVLWWKLWVNTRLKGFSNQSLNHRSLRFLVWSLSHQAADSGGIFLLCPVQKTFPGLFEGMCRCRPFARVLWKICRLPLRPLAGSAHTW